MEISEISVLNFFLLFQKHDGENKSVSVKTFSEIVSINWLNTQQFLKNFQFYIIMF